MTKQDLQKKQQRPLPPVYKSQPAPLRRAGAIACLLLSLSLTPTLQGCANKETVHGHVISSNDLQQVQPGMGKEQVRLLLGTPDTTATYVGEVYYYISTTMNQTLFLKPKLTQRKIAVVYFTKEGTVDHIANYGLKDGKIFDYITRETPAAGADTSLLTELFGSMGAKNKIFKDSEIP